MLFSSKNFILILSSEPFFSLKKYFFPNALIGEFLLKSNQLTAYNLIFLTIEIVFKKIYAILIAM